MQDIIALSILLTSGLGMFFIIIRKAPALSALKMEKKESGSFQRVKGAIAAICEKACSFSPNKLLHKLLSKTKISTLKLERFLDSHLQKLRKKTNNTIKFSKDKTKKRSKKLSN